MPAVKGETQRAINDPRIRRSLSYVGASTVNQELFDRGLRHSIFFEGLKTTEVNKVVRYFNNQIAPDVVDTLRSRLAKAKKLGVDRGPWTTRYYKDMMNEVLGTVRGGMKNTSKRVTQQLAKIGYAEAQFAGDSLEGALPFNFDARVPSLPMVRAVVQNTPVNGKLIPTWFNELGDSMQAKIVQQVNLGLTTGEPVQKIIRRLTSQGGVFDVTRRNAETLVRTQMTHVSNKARELTYEQNDNVIKGVRYVATLDARTTDVCAGLDGQVFKPTEGPRPPLHMRCRSTTVPVTKSWKELGKEFKVDAFKKLKEPKTDAMLRASMNGSVPAKTTYNAWLKTQPKAFQNQVLGPRRANLFRRNHLHLSRFTDYGLFPPKPLTIRDLLAYEKAVIAGTKSGGAGGIAGRLGTRGKKKVTKKVTKKKVTKKVTRRTAPPTTPRTSGKSTSQMTGDELATEAKRRLGPKIEQMEIERKSAQDLLSARRALEVQRNDKAREIAPVLRESNPKIKSIRDERGKLNRDWWDAKSAVRRSRTKANKGRLEAIEKQRSKLWESESGLINAEAERRLGKEFAEKIMRARSVHLQAQTRFETLQREIREAIHEMLFLDDAQRGSSISLTGIKFKSGEVAVNNWNTAKAWLEKVVHRDTANQAIRATKARRMRKGGRSECDPNGTLGMASDARSQTWVHEWIHRVEDFSEAHMASSRAFYNRRVRAAQARGEREASLRSLTGNDRYKAHETAWKDDFYTPYCGKGYYSGSRGVYGNETATMGVESLFADPAKLLTMDADHFAFSVDFLRSRIGKNFGRKWSPDLLSSNRYTGTLLD